MGNFSADFFPYVEYSTNNGLNQIYSETAPIFSLTQCAAMCHFDSLCHFFALTIDTDNCKLGNYDSISNTTTTPDVVDYYIKEGT